MNHPNAVRSTNSIQKFICQIRNEMNLPKRPPPGVWVSLGVNWSDGRDSVNDGKGRQSTHNHRTIKYKQIVNPQTNTNTTTQTNCQLTTKYKQIVNSQPNANTTTQTNCQPTIKYQHNHTNKLSTHNRIQTKLTIFPQAFLASIPFKRSIWWNKLKRKYCVDLWLAPPKSFQ